MTRFTFVFGWSRRTKLLISATIDALGLVLACFTASYIRLESFDLLYSPNSVYTVLATVGSALLLLYGVGTYKTMIRFSGVTLAQNMALAVAGSVAVMVLASFYSQAHFPRTVPIIYGLVAYLGLTFPRFALRTLYQRTLITESVPVAIYGAGDAGRKVEFALRNSRDFQVKLFVDDAANKRGISVQDLRVFRSGDLPHLINKYGIQKIILALPGISRNRRSEILAQLESLSVEVLTIPNLTDLLTGKAKIEEVQQVDIYDLLGRDRIAPYQNLMTRHIEGRSVLVTGAGGSIGSELCRQIALLRPRQLVLFEMNEYALYAIEQELIKFRVQHKLDFDLIPILGSVQTYQRLYAVFQRFSIDTLYHAAAYKHVPMVEHNVVEGIRNNVMGTYFTARAAIDAGVKNFVLISTDKAVRPTNVMGATKRYAELVCQGFAEDKEIKTNFSMVRFGNVLGSSGSVVPVFRDQIKAGGPVTVTHPDITRYFMTIPEAAQLVIQAGAMAQGGEVFVLDMGEPVKIVDLATRMISLSGFKVRNDANPNGDIDITFSGLRSGEKLYEELLISADVEKTEHQRIMMANEMYLDHIELKESIDELEKLCVAYDIEKIRAHLIAMPLEYFPVSGNVDLVGTKAPVVDIKMAG